MWSMVAPRPVALPDNVHPFPEPDDRPEREAVDQGFGELFDLEELIHDDAPIGRVYSPPGEGHPPKMNSDLARWWLRTFNSAGRLDKVYTDAEIQSMTADDRRAIVEQVFTNQGIKVQPVAA